MKIDGTAYRSVWLDADDRWSVHILDQTRLPWSLDVLRLTTRDEAAHAIKSMQTRGAPLIGAVAAYGLCLALRADASTEAMERDAALINATRPTGIRVAEIPAEHVSEEFGLITRIRVMRLLFRPWRSGSSDPIWYCAAARSNLRHDLSSGSVSAPATGRI